MSPGIASWSHDKVKGTSSLMAVFISYQSHLKSLFDELMVTRVRGEGLGGEIVREFGTDRHTLLYLKWITNKDLLYSTGNSAQNYVTT